MNPHSQLCIVGSGSGPDPVVHMSQLLVREESSP